MTTSRFRGEQTLGFLKQAEAGPVVKKPSRRHGMSNPTFYRWKSKYGAIKVNQASRLRELERAIRELKPSVAERAFETSAP